MDHFKKVIYIHLWAYKMVKKLSIIIANTDAPHQWITPANSIYQESNSRFIKK